MQRRFFTLTRSLVCLLLLVALNAEARTLKLFLIGNSFSQATSRPLMPAKK